MYADRGCNIECATCDAACTEMGNNLSSGSVSPWDDPTTIEACCTQMEQTRIHKENGKAADKILVVNKNLQQQVGNEEQHVGKSAQAYVVQPFEKVVQSEETASVESVGAPMVVHLGVAENVVVTFNTTNATLAIFVELDINGFGPQEEQQMDIEEDVVSLEMQTTWFQRQLLPTASEWQSLFDTAQQENTEWRMAFELKMRGLQQESFFFDMEPGAPPMDDEMEEVVDSELRLDEDLFAIPIREQLFNVIFGGDRRGRLVSLIVASDTANNVQTDFLASLLFEHLAPDMNQVFPNLRQISLTGLRFNAETHMGFRLALLMHNSLDVAHFIDMADPDVFLQRIMEAEGYPTNPDAALRELWLQQVVVHNDHSRVALVQFLSWILRDTPGQNRSTFERNLESLDLRIGIVNPDVFQAFMNSPLARRLRVLVLETTGFSTDHAEVLNFDVDTGVFGELRHLSLWTREPVVDWFNADVTIFVRNQLRVSLERKINAWAGKDDVATRGIMEWFGTTMLPKLEVFSVLGDNAHITDRVVAALFARREGEEEMFLFAENSNRGRLRVLLMHNLHPWLFTDAGLEELFVNGFLDRLARLELGNIAGLTEAGIMLLSNVEGLRIDRETPVLLVRLLPPIGPLRENSELQQLAQKIMQSRRFRRRRARSRSRERDV